MNSTSEYENITLIIQKALDNLNKLYNEEMYKLNKTMQDDIAAFEDRMVDNLVRKILTVSTLKYLTFSAIPPYNFLIIQTIIHACICAVGYLGNVITCIVILSHASMRTTTNIYLFNLAIADLIMLTSGYINYTIACWYPYKNNNDYGMKGCFFFNWVSDIAVNVSIMTITVFTIERYLAICHPFLARKMLTTRKALKFILLIWIIGTLFGYLIYSQRKFFYLENEDMPLCIYEDATRYVVEIETLIFFVLPFILILVLYSLIWINLVDSSKIQKNQGSISIKDGPFGKKDDDDANKNILKMLVTIVAIFFFIWAPYHFVRIFLLHLDELPLSVMCSYIDRVYFSDIDLYLETAYLTVYFSSSAINPIIYNIMSKKFRDAFKKVFKCWNICRLQQLIKMKHILNHKSKSKIEANV